MAVIQVESVAITKSRLAKGFNGDNLNLNGKVISSQEADAGFKAAGNVKPPYVAVIASGNQKGFAAGAAAAFNDYVKDVNINKYNAEAVINRFFDDMESVVEKCSIDGARLSIAIVCAYDDCVIAAKTGNCHILRFSEGELFEIALSEDGERGFQFVDVIADGDVFSLIGEESSADIDYDGIVNIFDKGDELKLAVREVFKLLSASARGKDCSVILMKLNCDSERTYAALPVSDYPDDAFDSAVSESPDEFDVSDNEENIAYEDAQAKAKKASKKKILGLIPVVILVILLAVAAALYFATRPEKPDEEGTSAPDIVVVVPEEDSTGDFNGSNGMQSVEDDGPGGEAGELEDDKDKETTTKAPETTTRRPSNSYPSTPRPSTTQPSTSAPETTTQSDETTTVNTETTTANTETTTANTETTTVNTETTTQNNETPTTQAPTTQAPTTQTPEETPEEPVNEEPVNVVAEDVE